MSRRKHADMDFGSDSFLDIIANIVGILIILIVIAGVRVSQQALKIETAKRQAKTESIAAVEPVLLPPAPSPEPHDAEPKPALTDAVPLDPRLTGAILVASEPEKVIAPAPKPQPVPPAFVPETPEPIPPSPDLLNAIAGLNSELESLNQKSKQADESAKRFVAWNADLEAQIDKARKTLQGGWDQATEQKRQIEELKRSLEQTQLVFIGQQKKLSLAEQSAAPTETLRHKLTPVSRAVEGNEIHFHVKENRVAYVPLLELVERLKPQIQRQRDWLMKYREHSGRVGPYRGFQLDYVVVRQRLGALESARNGGLARVLPILLKFEPTDELTREALDQALRPGSVFIRELQMADVNTTLTFWVYPDSFGMYRQLKEFAHAEGFTVAARPLEEGEVIKASPWGSKSAGQ